jgi:hypothetical protein
MMNIEGIDIRDISQQLAYNMWQSTSEDPQFEKSPVRLAFDDWYSVCSGREDQIFRHLSQQFGASMYDHVIPLRLKGNPPFFVFKHSEKGLQIFFAANSYSSGERAKIISHLKNIAASKRSSFFSFFFKSKNKSANEWWQFTSSVAARTESSEVGGISKDAVI